MKLEKQNIKLSEGEGQASNLIHRANQIVTKIINQNIEQPEMIKIIS